MANPQCEGGFTRLANELLDVATVELSSEEVHVWLVVVRKTYGFNRKEAELSQAELAAACGMPVRTLQRIMAALVARGVLYYSEKRGPRPKMVGPQKDYDLWEKRPAKNGVSTKRPAKNGVSRPAKNGVSKASYQCDERHKKKTVPRTPSDEALRIAREYHDRIRLLYPTLTRSLAEKADIEGALVLDDLVGIDGHSWDDVRSVLRWVLTDSFWSKNMRSLAGARKKASGSGGSTKFENAMAKMMDVSQMLRGVMPRPMTVARNLTEEEERNIPNCLGFKNSPNGKEAGKIGPGIDKAG
jgi:phage replication O-like protein O